jgi:hypothetical protein
MDRRKQKKLGENTMYSANIFYKDDKSITVHLQDEEVNTFFKELNEGRIYRHENGNGFWTNLNDIRYITVVKQNPEENTNEKTQEEQSEV